MRYSITNTALAGILLLVSLNPAFAQKPQKGTVVVPASSIEKESDIGRRSHTNIRVFVPQGGFTDPNPLVGPPFSGFNYETPASLGCVYHIVTPVVAGCNPNTVTANPVGGSKAIAIVDAYDDPGAAADLAAFSTQFGLPAATFSVVFATGVRPPGNSGWELEESLDIEWAHAMAPNATLYLVEAASNSNTDLYFAEDKASALVAAAGGGEVSNSWGASEFSGETSLDSHFTTSTVVYFASSGDKAGVSYPSASPNVVSAGGTTFRRDPITGKFIGEIAWDEAGGGKSAFEPRPSYQSGVAGVVGTARGTPDFSSDSDPNTGVWVLDSGNGGWFIVGGTSAASPTLAGIVNLAGDFNSSSNTELTEIYGSMALSADFNDIKAGYCGPYVGYAAVKGYDFCTGVGSDKGTVGK
jgi:kumamolisin